MERAAHGDSPQPSRAENRRRHLLDTARSLFIEQGFHKTGIAQIAAESGIKVGQIYRDFESKEAIIAAICEMDATAWLEEDVLTDAVERADVPAIRAWLTRFNGQEDSEEYRLVAEIIAEAGRNPRVADIYRKLDARLFTSLSAAFAALAPAGTGTAAITALAELIMIFGVGMASRRIVLGEAGSREASRMIERVLTFESASLFKCHAPSEEERS